MEIDQYIMHGVFPIVCKHYALMFIMENHFKRKLIFATKNPHLVFYLQYAEMILYILMINCEVHEKVGVGGYY